eukprot:scaffold2910_cov390-Prasinococcus_capsulatus_cf.AAC.24
MRACLLCVWLSIKLLISSHVHTLEGHVARGALGHDKDVCIINGVAAVISIRQHPAIGLAVHGLRPQRCRRQENLRPSADRSDHVATSPVHHQPHQHRNGRDAVFTLNGRVLVVVEVRACALALTHLLASERGRLLHARR